MNTLTDKIKECKDLLWEAEGYFAINKPSHGELYLQMSLDTLKFIYQIEGGTDTFYDLALTYNKIELQYLKI